MKGRITDAEQQHFVEHIGRLCEDAGYPRMAGRVLGSLLICEYGRQSFSELVEELQASKGSISAMTRYLIQLGLVQRVTLPGDRRDYFQLCDDAWTQFLKQRVSSISRFRDAAERTLPLMRTETPERRARLEGMLEFYSWWERESAAVLARWEERRAATRTRKVARV